MKRHALILFLIGCLNLSGQVSLDYYLGSKNDYNPEIPKPETILGYQVGEWHVSHDRLVSYMHTLAAASPRLKIENRGTTYEGRPLILLTVSSEENIANLEEIRKKHIGLISENSSCIKF